MNIMRMISAHKICITIILSVLFSSTAFSATDPSQVRIGVLAYRGSEHAVRMWKPTTDYLTSRIPGHTFVLVPLDFEDINPEVSKGGVDFILANSSIYVELEYLYGVSRIATMKKKAATRDGFITLFGGVIFTRADRKDITSLEALKGKSFVAVDETSLGGWRVAWRELKEHGINPGKDLSSLTFAGTHDAAVLAVRSGNADAGTVRTDILESMEQDNRISLREFRILNPQQHTEFPFASSTRLYPEWPFAKVKHTSNDLSQKVAVALMTLDAQDEAAKSADIAGWTIPLDYNPVHEMLRELRLKPYEDFGKITLAEALMQYWYIITLAIAFLLAAAGITIHVSRLNTGLVEAKREIEDAQRDLEKKVDERTRDLRKINEELEQEIVQRRQAEEALKESERRFRETLEGAHMIALQVDMEGTVIFANAYLAQLTGWELKHIIGRNWFDLFIPGENRDVIRQIHQENTSGKMVKEFASEILTQPGERKLISWSNSHMLDSSGRLIGVTSLGMDITYRQQIEEQLLKTQKLDAVGTLAGGIAHDFNNLLQGIFGYIYMAKLNSTAEGKAYRFLDEAEKAISMATNLSNQLLTFSKGGQPVKQHIAIDKVIQDSVKLGLSGSRSDYRIMLDEDLWQVDADPGQIGQVVQNIVINASDSMPEGGTIAISAENVSDQVPEGPDAKLVKITIEDTGTGISEADRRRIFDPYFTTKQTGSGLGLATAYSIVKNHGGRIEVESQQGKGSCFTIYLPAVTEQQAADQQPSESPEALRRKKILVMDDEDMVQKISGEMLRTLGHVFEIAADGEEAIAKYEAAAKEGTPFDAVILDLTIRGGMGGDETNRRLRELDPKVTTIISSGYSDDTTISKYQELGFKGYLKKPYSVADLREVLFSALNVD